MDGLEPIDNIIASVTSAQTLSELSSLCEAAGHVLGFGYYTILQPAMTGSPVAGLLLTNYPADWIRQTVKNYNYLNSPVMSLAAQTAMPFEWSDLPCHIRLTPSQQAYLRQIERMGIRSGFTVPIQTPNDTPGMVSFVSDQRRVLDTHTKAYSVFLAFTAFQRGKDLQNAQRPEPVRHDPVTADIVKLMLRGRSLRLIAEKLAIPASEVAMRVEKAREHFPEGSNIALVAQVLYAPHPLARTRAAAPKVVEAA